MHSSLKQINKSSFFVVRMQFKIRYILRKIDKRYTQALWRARAKDFYILPKEEIEGEIRKIWGKLP